MAIHELIEARLSYSVIGAFFEVYNRLGPGFLESIYARALEIELTTRGHHVAREVLFSVFYKGHVLGFQRLDMVVDHKVVVETKSTLELHPVTSRQVGGYLQASKLQLALLLHFGPLAKFYRIVRRDRPHDVDNSFRSD
ncbi:MAG: GxxExxY protein [Gemmatimonadaceae bacterium]